MHVIQDVDLPFLSTLCLLPWLGFGALGLHSVYIHTFPHNRVYLARYSFFIKRHIFFQDSYEIFPSTK